MRPTARVRYPDVCSRMLTYAHVCSPRSVTGCARICIRRAPHTSRGALLHFLIIFFNPPPRRIPRASRIKKSFFLIPLFFQGEYRAPVVALCCNFVEDARAQEPLLSHHELETLLHEFGHVLHSVLGRTRFQHLSGSSCLFSSVC